MFTIIISVVYEIRSCLRLSFGWFMIYDHVYDYHFACNVIRSCLIIILVVYEIRSCFRLSFQLYMKYDHVYDYYLGCL